MQAYDLYRDISERTQGDVYIGIVGPVRTGKSTFITKFMEKLVIPGIENAHIRARAQDELPQSGSGRTIMTTQPAFVPNDAVEVTLPSENRVRLRLIDSVGYLVDGALGTQEGEALRMVRTPWVDGEIPFERAAEIGTQKVIGEHSTIGLVITTDGSVTDLPRSSYVPAEARVIEELKALQKPFAVILNTENPANAKAQALRRTLENDYGVPVVALNVAQIEEEDIRNVLEKVLGQFPVVSMSIQTPEWLGALDSDHWLIDSLMSSLVDAAPQNLRIEDVHRFAQSVGENPYLDSVTEKTVEHGSGTAYLQMNLREGLFNQILAEQCGTEIKSDAHLLSLLRELVAAKREYDHVAQALQAVRETGYGLVPPLLEEMTLQEPEIMKQGGRFGVRLRASAPSLHMIRVDIQTEVSPVVGTEQQSEEMIRYMMEGFEQDPQKLWGSNLFGKPLSDLVREGLSNKLMHMPADTQLKVQQTLEKIINEGTGGMVCILL
ncbi:MAG: stage IV sporulation protein A [Clostridiales bacterium]|nr:stage IV sporulation protein A [Clostridiales bacterium]MDY3832221.1 stage IV sporulation protein A [Candidatus Ventricola sp.]MDY4541324.1 stage IV sporulation protein A [Candidatus Ventricola sp.]